MICLSPFKVHGSSYIYVCKWGETTYFAVITSRARDLNFRAWTIISYSFPSFHYWSCSSQALVAMNNFADHVRLLGQLVYRKRWEFFLKYLTLWLMIFPISVVLYYKIGHFCPLKAIFTHFLPFDPMFRSGINCYLFFIFFWYKKD